MFKINFSLVRLIRNRCFESVFNVTSILMFLLMGKDIFHFNTLNHSNTRGVTLPIHTSSTLTLLVESEEDPGLVCEVQIFASWILFVSISSVGVLSIVYK